MLHYTVETLEDTLRIFSDPYAQVRAHLVVAENGDVHEVVPCWDGTVLEASHAGQSRWPEVGSDWTGFNRFSIGIEIVNKNGNVFTYSDEQYASLASCLLHLQQTYRALQQPERILGHEHIAGFRGKVDPGARFDWGRLFREAYPHAKAPRRAPRCPPSLLSALQAFEPAEPQDPERAALFWRAVNLFTERCVALVYEADAATASATGSKV